MSTERWTWSDQAHPRVLRLFDTSIGHDWCGHLESAPGDAILGKVLCVCAAAAIARGVLGDTSGSLGGGKEVGRALDLLGRWIDDPTEEQFERICGLIFGEDQPWPDSDPHGVAWWALRTATSSVGNFEAGWALNSLCDAATSAGFSGEVLREIAKRELLSRARGHS